MKNFKNILFGLLILFSVGSFAQQGMIIMPLEQDSSQIELNKQIEYRQLISGQLPAGLLPEKITLPGFNFNEEYEQRYTFSFNSYSFGSFPAAGFSAGSMNPFYSPLFQNATIFSEAAYKIGDKFTFGGFSYGLNPMMMPPPVPGINNFNRYGSTMFMQYKVGKNFKIETRVNVSQGSGY